MIISQTPYRVSFAGGGTDLPAYYEREPGAVLSVTVQQHMYVTVSPRFDPSTRVAYTKTEICESIDEIEHTIAREALRTTGLGQHIEITTIGDVPAGTGMGSSSSLGVGLLNALYAYRGEVSSPRRLAEEACHIEIDLLGKPIGRQDHYAAAFGGLNVIEFRDGGRVSVEPVTVSRDAIHALEDRLLMFYTGEQRSTRTVLADQGRNVANDEQKFAATARMVGLVYEMRDALFAADLPTFGDLLHRNWELKRSLSKHISNPAIDEAYETARRAGARGGKLLGAGGGGFLLVYCEPELQPALRQALAQLDEFEFRFDLSGSSIIFTDGSDKASSAGFVSSRERG